MGLDHANRLMKDQSKNRAAQLTPSGMGAIAVVRLAGPAVGEFLAKHFAKTVSAGHCVHGNLSDESGVIDDPVVVLRGNVADINLHGGPWVVRECLELARRAGFAISEDARDLPPDSSNPIEQEMVEALPLARTEQAIRLLLAQPRLWADLRSDDVQRMLNDHWLWWMLHPPRVAVVGAANVGKSTLTNALFGQERSITADVPGTTRDWVGDWANLDGLPIMLLDTPGQRDCADPIERAAIRQSDGEIARADLVIIVLDPTQPLEPDQNRILARHPKAITVINKTDLRPMWELAIGGAIGTVATLNMGIDELRCRIREYFGCAGLDHARPCWWTDRQRISLEQRLSTSSLLPAPGVSTQNMRKIS